MRVITLNLNGIRSASSKGFFDWMKHQNADVVCVQETKAQQHQLTAEMLAPRGYHGYFFDAEKKGYAGVALYVWGISGPADGMFVALGLAVVALPLSIWMQNRRIRKELLPMVELIKSELAEYDAEPV